MAINSGAVPGFPPDRGGIWIKQDPSAVVDNVFIVQDSGGTKWKLAESHREPYFGRYAGAYGVGDKTSALQTALNHASVSKVVIDNSITISGTLTIPTGKVVEFVRGGLFNGSGTITGSGSYLAEERQNCFGSGLTISILPENNVVTPAHFGAVIDNSTDDGPAMNRLFRYMEALTRQFPIIMFPAGRYVVNTTVNLPGNLATSNGLQPILMLGYGVEISTTADIPVFYRYPPDQTTALNTWINSYIGVIKGFRFIGNSTIGSPKTSQKAMYIGAIYNWVIADCRASAFHVPFQFEFSLKCTFENLNISSFTLDGFVGTYGGWSGGSATNSAFNANTIRGLRLFCINGSQSGIHLRGMDQTLVQSCVVEGAAPLYNYWLEDAGSTGVNVNTFDHCWNEAVSVSPPTVNFKLASRNITRIIACQRIYPDTYFDATGYDVGEIIVDSLPYVGNIPTGANSFFIKSAINGVSYKFINSGSGTVMTTPTNWDGDALPGSLHVESKQVGIYELNTSGIFRIIGGYGNSTIGNRRIDLDGNIIAGTDDVHMWGGRGATSTGSSLIRPHTIHTGNGGVNIDFSGKYRWRDGTGASDIALSRDAAGVLEIESTAATILPKGTAAQRPTGVSGQTRYITDTNSWEGYNGSIWQPIGEKIDKFSLTTTGLRNVAVGETIKEIHLKPTSNMTIDVGLALSGAEISEDLPLIGNETTIVPFRRTADSAFDIHFTGISGGTLNIIFVKTIY